MAAVLFAAKWITVPTDEGEDHGTTS
jgi:hypothetical protein